jgi:hypothetical protein
LLSGVADVPHISIYRYFWRPISVHPLESFAMATQTATLTSVAGDAIQMRRLGRDGIEVEESTATQHDQTDQPSSLDLARVEGIEPQTQSTDEAKEYPTGLKFWLIILTLVALLVIGGLDTNIVATAVPR